MMNGIRGFFGIRLKAAKIVAASGEEKIRAAFANADRLLNYLDTNVSFDRAKVLTYLSLAGGSGKSFTADEKAHLLDAPHTMPTKTLPDGTTLDGFAQVRINLIQATLAELAGFLQTLQQLPATPATAELAHQIDHAIKRSRLGLPQG